MDGTLALIGGREFTEGCTFDAALVGDATEVLLIPAALAYENPSAAIGRAVEWFSPLGVTVRVLDVYRRADAMDPVVADLARSARAVYVTGGSPMHLRSVLKDTALLDALIGAWRDGAMIASRRETSTPPARRPSILRRLLVCRAIDSTTSACSIAAATE